MEVRQAKPHDRYICHDCKHSAEYMFAVVVRDEGQEIYLCDACLAKRLLEQWINDELEAQP